MTEPLPEELQQAVQLLFAGISFKASGPSFYRLGMVDIKMEYRKKAMLFHPDRSVLLGENRGLLEEKFKQINHAYGILKSEFKEKSFILRLKSVVPPVTSGNQGSGDSEAKRGRAAPVQKAPVPEFFFNGALPKRALRLGEYLFYRRVISWGTLINAIVWQYRNRPRLGAIALQLNYLNPQDIGAILKGRLLNEPFGQAAVRLGFISDYRRFVLLGRQRRYGLPLGKFFLDLQIFHEAELEQYLQENRLHNSLYNKSI